MGNITCPRIVIFRMTIELLQLASLPIMLVQYWTISRYLKRIAPKMSAYTSKLHITLLKVWFYADFQCWHVTGIYQMEPPNECGSFSWRFRCLIINNLATIFGLSKGKGWLTITKIISLLHLWQKLKIVANKGSLRVIHTLAYQRTVGSNK